MKRTISEDEKFLSLASGDLRKQWKQVVWDTLRVLTHDTTWVGTGGVEVSQQRSIPLATFLSVASLVRVVALGVDHVSDGGFHGEFCVSVRVGRPQGALFGDGDHVGEAGGISIYGGGAGEDDVGDIVTEHRSEEAD